MFLHTSFESSLFREQNVRFALTNRVGGASVGAFNALNLGFNVGDMFQNVVRNHQKVAMCLYEECHIAQEKRKPLYYMEQIHSAESIVLDEALESRLLESQHLQRGEQDFATRDFKDSICIGKTDAIITHLPYRICLVLVADCNPLLLYDAKHHAMAVIHAGRRGVFDRILPQTLAKMTTLYGTKAADCLLYVGASIRSCCYEVGQEVRDELLRLGFESSAMNGNKLDLIHCIYTQCENLGIKQEHIEINPHCSCCNDNLYSYRREGITGRFGLLAMLV
ncbi:MULTISPECIES: polyphenol oxidase family protein [Helicobacter]|uniref:COG1496: Uncharacterized protein n=3 Tax=Helicobacter typhlonius TaxID=76936 RepID=A0A099UAG2_9HELI|nr:MULTISPECIES: polyphenol oxidase family protein [Helicobacter]TLD78438.1 laccase domain-containing protein [Helicobacter typhlonius]TLD88744.1 laccase domain-containing protein [Helicobacter sp. MIT 03-1616]CUU39675.1 COG1496: Uncharacterized protein [Helicobacter typhlonius]